MKIQKNRKVEREAVNAAREFFESNNCFFQEVNLQNDYGKDAYIDLVEGEDLTGLCIAVQIKGGVSYRRSGGYGIPLDKDHARVWRQSSIPVAGLVYDPDDQKLRWCNITSFLEHVDRSLPSYIPVDSKDVLCLESLRGKFRSCFHSCHAQRVIGPALLRLTADNESERCTALLDCFALGRSDLRVLILIRHLLGVFKGEDLRVAIYVLAHATAHPDIFWTKDNWIPETVCTNVRPYLQWSEAEIARLMKSASWEEWQRGCPGQDIYSLLSQDPQIATKMGEVAIRALKDGDDDLAWSAMYLVIYWARREGVEMYKGFLSIDRRFRSLPLSGELEWLLGQYGYVPLFG